MFTASSCCAFVLSVAALSGCGDVLGAGAASNDPSGTSPRNEPEAVALSKYLGTWRSICHKVSSDESEQASITISAAGAGSGQLLFTNRMAVYEGTECSGTAVVGTTTGTFTFMGKRQVGKVAVDKVVTRVTGIDAPNAPFVPRETKDLLTIINNRLYSGNVDVSAPRDGDGYPKGLWMDFPSTQL